jgi:hypothetical protein
VVRAVTASIRRWSPLGRLVAGLIAIACCLSYSIYSVAHSESVFVAGDARFYLGIAIGDYSQVMQPFASRQLGALVVAALVHVLHWTVERGFLVEGGVSIVVMIAAIYPLALRTAAPRWLLFAMALVPFWAFLLQDLVLPDLWYSALLAVMLLMLASERMLGAALMMFPLMLSRESTSLTLICFLIAGWGWMRWRDRIIAVVSTIAGSVMVSHLAARAQPNLEQLPESIYMLAKVPWNFMHNVLGITPWSNVNPELCTVPIWTMPVHLGPVRAIGICGFSLAGWIEMTQAMLNDFGLLPLLVAFLWWRCRKFATRNVLLRFTLLYGGVSVLVAPMLGTWFVRLIGYAWPLFFVALPLLFDRLVEASPKGSRAVASAGFFGVHLALFYTAYRWMWPAQISIDLALWVIGFLLLRQWFGKDDCQPLDEFQTQRRHKADPA